jgi:hypothetical protein
MRPRRPGVQIPRAMRENFTHYATAKNPQVVFIGIFAKKPAGIGIAR